MRFSTMLAFTSVLAVTRAHAQPAPPYAAYWPPDPCEEECAEKGRCTWDPAEEECTATTSMMCASSRICVEDGSCSMDGEGGCDDGRERASTPSFAVGLTIVGLGGAGVVGGFLAILTGALKLAGNGRANEDALMAGGIAFGVGVGVGLLLGLPLTLHGAERVPRNSVKVVVDPTSARLEVAF